MDLGDSTVKGKPHPDATTPIDVADDGTRRSKNLTRYHPSDNDSDEVEPDETSAEIRSDRKALRLRLVVKVDMASPVQKLYVYLVPSMRYSLR